MVTAYGASSQRRRLAGALRALRLRAGLTQAQLADRCGWTQARVSRLETAETKRISIPDLTLWLDATGASADERHRLLTLAEAILTGPRSWDEARAEDGDLQKATGRVESAAGLIRVYQPLLIPGLLQTAAYARRVISAGPGDPPEDLEERVAGRMDRQRVLDRLDQRFEFIVTEACLRWPFGPIPEHLDQLVRLRDVLHRPNVTLGILPLAPMPSWRTHGFVVYDDVRDPEVLDSPLVHVELRARPVNLDAPEHVALYRAIWAGLLDAAVTGADALALLDRVATDLRAQTG